MKRTHLVLCIIFVIVNVLDVISTHYALKQPGVYEVNPIARYLFQHNYYSLLILLKVLPTGGMFLFCWYIEAFQYLVHWFLVICNFVVGVVVINNFLKLL